MITEADVKAAYFEGWDDQQYWRVKSNDHSWSKSAAAKKCVDSVVKKQLDSTSLIDTIRDEIFIAPRELTDEEWDEVSYNVNRKTPGSDKDIPVWVFKEVLKYVEFNSGFRARAKMTDVIMREAVSGVSLYPEGPEAETELRKRVIAYVTAVNHKPESGSEKAWRKHDKDKNDAFEALCKFVGL